MTWPAATGCHGAETIPGPAHHSDVPGGRGTLPRLGSSNFALCQHLKLSRCRRDPSRAIVDGERPDLTARFGSVVCCNVGNPFSWLLVFRQDDAR